MLLHALYVAVPVALVLGLIAAVAGPPRPARSGAQRFAGRSGLGRLARSSPGPGSTPASPAALALGVYGVLRWAQ